MSDYITSEEFTRWTGQLDRRLDEHHSMVQGSLERIDGHLDGINGRTRMNTESIGVLKTEVVALEVADRTVAQRIDHLATEGCAHYAAHTKMLEQLGGVSVWTPQRKAAVAGTLVGTGTLLWPAIEGLVKALQRVVGR